MEPACLVVTTTVDSREVAEEIARSVVAGRVAACAQVAGPISSTYRWQGVVEQATEWYCHMKTTRARQAALEAEVRRLHPYQLPEIVAVPLLADAAYLGWIEEAVRSEP